MSAEAFFKKHGVKSARELAYAEAEARRRGWTFSWEGDVDFDPRDWEGEPPDEVLCVALRGGGRVLGSLCGVADPSRENYGRVVEAELALEALSNERRERRSSGKPYRRR